MGAIGSTGLDVWNHMMRMNATTCFLCCREAVKAMSGSEGRIVNVAARPVLVPTGQMTAYSASKAAVAALTLSLSEELSASSIWVNAIVPLAGIAPGPRHLLFAGEGASQDVRAGNRYFIENVREALDAPGEWFLDNARGEVLHIPDVPGFPDGIQGPEMIELSV